MSAIPWVTAALAAAVLAACSGSVEKGNSDSGTRGPSGDGSAGSSGDGSGGGCPSAPATVYLTSTIGPGASEAQPCQLQAKTPELEIGSVEVGVTNGTAGATVTCSVVPNGSGFTVAADVTAPGGSFAVSGPMPSSGTASGITVSLGGEVLGASLVFTGTSCSVTLADASTPGFDPSSGPPIAAGRVWATVTCEDMTVSGQIGHVCQGAITFRLENCAGSPSSACH